MTPFSQNHDVEFITLQCSRFIISSYKTDLFLATTVTLYYKLLDIKILLGIELFSVFQPFINNGCLCLFWYFPTSILSVEQ